MYVFLCRGPHARTLKKCTALSDHFRFVQVACELELWQEAFRSVEDIQNLFVLGKRQGKPQMMAVYYARLTKIFTVSEYHLQNG